MTQVIQRFGDGRDWFFQKRFGLFVHWGLYAIDGWHEQMQYRLQIPKHEYVKLIEKFNPQDFDPEQWLDLAESAGMEYICFTTKHCDGFCLYNSSFTDYNVMNTPFGKDIVKLLAEACHKRNMPLCLYYSVPDMHHPNYPHRGKPYERWIPDPSDSPDLMKYVDYVTNQVTELCSNYGEIHSFWWDGGTILDFPYPAINALIHELQPKAVINNRGFFDEGDFGTPERDWYEYVNTASAFDKPTEACQSIGTQSWGYRKDEDYYSDRHLMESMIKIMAKGGNYLLNAGPMADGNFPEEADRILRNLGQWLKPIRDSLYNVEPINRMVANPDILLTRKGNKLYVHLYKLPKSDTVWLKPIETAPIIAKLLNTGEQVEASLEMTPSLYKDKKGMLRIRGLPVNEFTGSVMVLELEFEQFPEDMDPSLVAPEVQL